LLQRFITRSTHSIHDQALEHTAAATGLLEGCEECNAREEVKVDHRMSRPPADSTSTLAPS